MPALRAQVAELYDRGEPITLGSRPRRLYIANMTKTQIERYRQHPAWSLIELKQGALESVKYGHAQYEARRADLLAIFDAALRSRANPQAALYDDTLATIEALLNQLSTDENSFVNWTNQSYYADLKAHVRSLPGPPPRQVNESYLAALDAAVAARQNELNDLRAAATTLQGEVEEKSKRLALLDLDIHAQQTKITAAEATIAQVVSSADDQLRREWESELASWRQDREASNATMDQEMAGHVQLLSTAALTGRRLVEQAAGSLTAADWAGRAKRERWNAVSLRFGSFAAFAAAATVGAWIIWFAFDKELVLTVGDGILRGSLVLALAGIGSFLTVESRRHFREADSAEDVKLALAALEPFYAGADDSERKEVRRALGDTVFIKNTLSRFSSRDAAKNAAPSNEQLNQIVDMISKGADVATKAGRT